MTAIETVHIGEKLHFYPDELPVLLKVFNRFPVDQLDLSDDEKDAYYNLLDVVQEFCFANM